MQKRDAKPSSFQFFHGKKAFDEILLACVMEENQEARDPLLGILETIANYESTHKLKVYSQMTNIHNGLLPWIPTKLSLGEGRPSIDYEETQESNRKVNQSGCQ